MFQEHFEKKLKQILRITFGWVLEEEPKHLKGELFLFLKQDGKIIKTIHQSNIIVNTASILIARLLKDNTEPNAGISFLGVGSGNEMWDPFDPPAPTTSQTLLENEFFRKNISTSTFVDPQTAEPTTNHTNIVDYATTFSEAEAVGPIMELSLFGGEASSTIDTGTMVNWRTFPVINKTNAMTLTIIFRITA
jgi:hypothetical protein